MKKTRAREDKEDKDAGGRMRDEDDAWRQWRRMKTDNEGGWGQRRRTLTTMTDNKGGQGQGRGTTMREDDKGGQDTTIKKRLQTVRDDEDEENDEGGQQG